VEAEKAQIAETRKSTIFEGSKKVLSCDSQREALVEEVG
jgi:esterase/lipase